MSKPSEYLVLSRGRWHEDASPQQIQDAIDRFHVWHDRLVGERKMKPGKRLAIAAGNPCLAVGLAFEVRPIEAARASASTPSSETPGAWQHARGDAPSRDSNRPDPGA